jgi:UDP-glucose 4-epimerase
MLKRVRKEPAWAGLKSLVTGGSGFIGRHLCRRLCEIGSEVHATSRQPRPDANREGPIWWQADLADLVEARRVFAAAGPDIVFHLAGSVSASPDIELLLPTFHSLLTSTVNVLLAATECDCRRIVLTGSLTEPAFGEVEPIPQSPYAAAKWAASSYGRMFQSLYGTPLVILRPFMVYGPAQAPSKLIPSVALSLLQGEAPKLASGRTKADWVYIADVIEGFMRAATTPGIEGRTIDLGSGKLISIEGVVGRLVEAIGSPVAPVFGALPDRPGENEIAANTAVAFELLEWKASTPLETGLRQTVEWFRARAVDGNGQVFRH